MYIRCTSCHCSTRVREIPQLEEQSIDCPSCRRTLVARSPLVEGITETALFDLAGKLSSEHGLDMPSAVGVVLSAYPLAEAIAARAQWSQPRREPEAPTYGAASPAEPVSSAGAEPGAAMAAVAAESAAGGPLRPAASTAGPGAHGLAASRAQPAFTPSGSIGRGATIGAAAFHRQALSAIVAALAVTAGVWLWTREPAASVDFAVNGAAPAASDAPGVSWDGRVSESFQAATAPESTVFSRIRTDRAGRLLVVDGRSPDSALWAMCGYEKDAKWLRPVAILQPDRPVPGLRAGIVEDRDSPGTYYGVAIRMETGSGRWRIGSGVTPILETDLFPVTPGSGG